MKTLAIICMAILLVSAATAHQIPALLVILATVGLTIALVGIVAQGLLTLLSCWGLASGGNHLILKDKNE